MTCQHLELSESPVHDMSMHILASYFVITWLTTQLNIYVSKRFLFQIFLIKHSCDPVPLDHHTVHQLVVSSGQLAINNISLCKENIFA